MLSSENWEEKLGHFKRHGCSFFVRSISIFNVTEFDIFERVVVTTFAVVLGLQALIGKGMYGPT